MIITRRIRPDEMDPTLKHSNRRGTRLHRKDKHQTEPLEEGEFVILKDEPNAKDWYCAEIRAILTDRIEVNYYTTATPPLKPYRNAPINKRIERLRTATFLRTWCLNRGKGAATSTPPKTPHGKLNYLWWGKIPLERLNDHLLVRDIGLSAQGKLDDVTIEIAAKLKVPHHEGAGGDEDFIESDKFQRRSTRKRKRS